MWFPFFQETILIVRIMVKLLWWKNPNNAEYICVRFVQGIWQVKSSSLNNIKHEDDLKRHKCLWQTATVHFLNPFKTVNLLI
jgi:hypothetical protein